MPNKMVQDTLMSMAMIIPKRLWLDTSITARLRMTRRWWWWTAPPFMFVNNVINRDRTVYNICMPLRHRVHGMGHGRWGNRVCLRRRYNIRVCDSTGRRGDSHSREYRVCEGTRNGARVDYGRGCDCRRGRNIVTTVEYTVCDTIGYDAITSLKITTLLEGSAILAFLGYLIGDARKSFGNSFDPEFFDDFWGRCDCDSLGLGTFFRRDGLGG